ncbi:MAG: hypothetical protein FWD87_02120 [Spirochaetaceae bacterium]|nr:hypothetical protein [Spirochaetaceae bacterium]
MVKKKVLLIALICIAGLILVSCGRRQEEPNPDRDAAMALLSEVRELRAEWLRTGTRDETAEPFGRAKAIYDLSVMYVERGMYAESMDGLGQARTYYLRFLGR